MNAVNREHKQRWRGRHLVRNEFIFYERNSQLHRSVQYTNGYKNSARAKYVMAVFNRPRSMNQYSNKALRISGQTFIFGIFFVTKSPLGIARQKTPENLGAILEYNHIECGLFQMEIRKINPRRSRTLNLVISHCCFAEDGKEMYWRFITHVHSFCSAH